MYVHRFDACRHGVHHARKAIHDPSLRLFFHHCLRGVLPFRTHQKKKETPEERSIWLPRASSAAAVVGKKLVSTQGSPSCSSQKDLERLLISQRSSFREARTERELCFAPRPAPRCAETTWHGSGRQERAAPCRPPSSRREDGQTEAFFPGARRSACIYV